MIVPLLAAFVQGFASLFLASCCSEHPAPNTGDSHRSFGVFLLSLMAWLGWLIAIILLDRFSGSPAPAALVVVSAAVGGWGGLITGNRLAPKRDTDAG